MLKPMQYSELKDRLKKHERSQRWLSRKLNCSSNAVKKWCKNEMPISIDRTIMIRKWLP